MRVRQQEKGQAIAEFAIGIVAIMAVFSGLLVMGALGIENIQTLIAARGGADENAANDVIGDGGSSIEEWNYGNDKLLFTADDRAVTNSYESASNFRNQFIINGDEEDEEGNKVVLFDMGSMGKYGGGYSPPHNFVRDFPSQNLFVSAADLTSCTKVDVDPLGNRNIGDGLKRLFGWLMLGNRNLDFTIRESVYMPKLNVLRDDD